MRAYQNFLQLVRKSETNKEMLNQIGLMVYFDPIKNQDHHGWSDQRDLAVQSTSGSRGGFGACSFSSDQTAKSKRLDQTRWVSKLVWPGSVWISLVQSSLFWSLVGSGLVDF